MKLRVSRRELLIGGAHLGALWAIAFVQPLLDLLGSSPDFFVARGNSAGDILILQYKCEEDLLNFGVSTFFTFGIAEVLRRAR